MVEIIRPSGKEIFVIINKDDNEYLECIINRYWGDVLYWELENVIGIFAFDTDRANFPLRRATFIAKGTILYQCEGWEFDKRECRSDWLFVTDQLKPGELYVLGLPKGVSAFAELE